MRAAVTRAVREHREAGGTVQQSTGITAAAVARIEATAPLPRPRGRGMESPATAKARAALDVAIIRTMRDTLARVSEAAAFTWQQIERRPDGSATITFRRPKTDAETTAYLGPATVAALDAIRRGAEGAAPLFGLSTTGIKRRITDAAKAAGLEGVSSHGCRTRAARGRHPCRVRARPARRRRAENGTRKGLIDRADGAETADVPGAEGALISPLSFGRNATNIERKGWPRAYGTKGDRQVGQSAPAPENVRTGRRLDIIPGQQSRIGRPKRQDRMFSAGPPPSPPRKPRTAAAPASLRSTYRHRIAAHSGSQRLSRAP